MGTCLATMSSDTLHQVCTLVAFQEFVVAPSNRFTTFVALARLHCSSTLADAEDVPVRAGIPVSAIG